MKKFIDKIREWWLFHLANPVVRKGEHGGFKWVFRRFTLDITTISGNFSARFTAGEHPYGYLIMGKDDLNIEGFCSILYQIGSLLTTEKNFADDIQKALEDYLDRLNASAQVEENETEEEIAIEEVKQVQEYVEALPKEKRKIERDANGRFKKAVKELKK